MLEVERLGLQLDARRFEFTLRVARGECTALIGPSGAGKSTLLALIAGFERAASGRVCIDGEDVTGWPAAKRPVSSVFQEHNLFAHLDVGANVGLGIDPGLRLQPAERARVAAALAEVGLADMQARMPATLSGGERQRVALARALVRQRPVLLLDEPFAALGPAMREEMLALLAALIREQRLTTLLVSHHPRDASLIAAQTAFVDDGTVCLCEDTARLLARRDCPSLSAYLGAPQ